MQSTLSLFKRLSFRQAKYVVVIALILGLLSGFLQVYSDYFDTQESLVDTIGLTLNTVENSARQVMSKRDTVLANEVIASLFHYPYIHKVEFFDELLKQRFVTQQHALDLSRWRWVSDIIFEPQQEHTLVLYAQDKNQLIGRLTVTVDTHLLALNFFKRSAIVLATGITRNLILATILLVLFHYIVTRPLFQLVKTVHTIPTKNPEKIRLPHLPKHEEDELGHLIVATNKLLQHLDDKANEREQLLHDMRKAKQEVEKACQVKDDFLANVSHELRTPLNAVLGMMSLALETSLTNEQHKYLNIANKSGQSLLVLINDLLDFSQLESGQLVLIEKPFDIQYLVLTTTENMLYDICNKQLELNVFIDPSIPRNVIGDAKRIQQILNSLLSNAIKFTKQGEIDITVNYEHINEDKISLSIAVSDTGIGMDNAAQEEIFKLFEQVDMSSTRQYGGVGLGLTLIHSLLSLMQGEISVESTSGQGSIFTFHLDLKVDKTLPTINTAPFSIKNSLQGMNALVVDTSPKNHLFISTYLAYLGVSAEVSDGHVEVFAQLQAKSNYYHIIVINLIDSNKELPHLINALSLYKDSAKIPILLLSHSLYEHQDIHASHMYLNKPVQIEELYRYLVQLH